MNRIVIIGNGFDLAQGLETGYEHFLLDYLKGIIERMDFEEEDYFEDELIKFEVLEKNEFYSNKLLQTKSISEFLEHDFFKQKTRNIEDPFSNFLSQHKSQNYNVAKITFKSDFFRKLLISQNWTDIEYTYFEYLIYLFKSNQSNFKMQQNKDLISLLNSNFNFIKSKLIEYLKKIEASAQNQNSLTPFMELLKSQLQKPENEYLKRFFKVNNEKLMYFGLPYTYFLNFNYTKSIDFFINSFSPEAIHIQIHGNIDEPDSIIFGYGDDSNEHYKTLENYDMKELLEHIKSFYYPSQKHYIDLMNIIDSDEFDVIVLGHSLGLSDRVLLESIFEHENCKAIRLFHRGKKSHFYKLIALSRHFKNKQSMRKKIVEFDENDFLG